MSSHFDIHAFRHTVRAVFDLEARGGMYSPELHLHLSGPNGSPAGSGPKHWPMPLRRIFVGKPYDFGGMLTIRAPHISFGRIMRNHGKSRAIWSKLYKENQRIYAYLALDHDRYLRSYSFKADRERRIRDLQRKAS